jgi:phosphoribosyl 1,2-cyclic phosphodiesterase/prolyl-tRNA editing enzyme YbaK/EbsC (Cys-tRNA(Pro) deacylase)
MPDAATMRYTVLGCGSSPGTPRLNGDWGNCDPHNPRNRRLRASLLVERIAADGEKTCVVIDTGPDFRQQMLAAHVRQLDGVVYTHPHADHIHGIDDLRTFVLWQKRLMDVWADDATYERLEEGFGYCFQTPPGSAYPPILKRHPIIRDTPFAVTGPGGDIAFEPLCSTTAQIHSLGFRIGDFAYCSDVSSYPDGDAGENAGPRCADRRRAAISRASRAICRSGPGAGRDYGTEAETGISDPHAHSARLRDGEGRDAGQRRAVLRRSGHRTGGLMSEPVVPKPGSSMERVARDAERLGLAIELRIMDQSTRTAEDAAAACGCAKSARSSSRWSSRKRRSGQRWCCCWCPATTTPIWTTYQATYGLKLKRCDGRRVRDETGFAIGGVAPIGHKAPIATFMDESLMGYDTVWAAAGRPDSVFRVDPRALAKRSSPRIIAVRHTS